MRGALRSIGVAVCYASAVAACTSADPSAPSPRIDAGTRRFVTQSPDRVHAFPPHAIRADGVGPYKIGAPVSDVLQALPNPGDAHIELLQVGELVDWSLVRAESGAIVIGIDQGNRVAFIAVLAPGVARTEGGIEVGATGDVLLAALGPELVRGDRARDRRVFEMEKLPGVRFLTDASESAPPERARIVAVLVTGEPAPAPRARERVCRSGGELAEARSEIVAAARRPGGPLVPAPPAGPAPFIRFACVSSERPEALVTTGSELVLVGGEPGKLKRIAALPLAATEAASPLDTDGDGRDEVVVIRHQRGVEERSAAVEAHRWEAGKLVAFVDQRPFVVTRAMVRPAGVSPAQVDLAIEVRAERDKLIVDAIYLARIPVAAWDLAPLRPAELSIGRRAAPHPPLRSTGRDAAPPDAPDASDKDPP